MSTRFLKRYILPSDNHTLVGRIYDLSIAVMHFETYEELSRHPDCKYVCDVNDVLSMLTRRIESLNMSGHMLWLDTKKFKELPVSRYEWLIISADVFLARYISVVDCAMILVNNVFECGLAPEACTMHRLRKVSVPQQVLTHLGDMIEDQGILRKERNSRFHHGSERGFSSDDQMLRTGALFEHRFNGMVDENGQALPVERLFREGLVELQRDFNGVMRKMVKRIDRFYDLLQPEFERRFSPKFRAGPFARKRTA